MNDFISQFVDVGLGCVNVKNPGFLHLNFCTSCGLNMWHTYTMAIIYSRWGGYLSANVRLDPQASRVSWVWIKMVLKRFMNHFWEDFGGCHFEQPSCCFLLFAMVLAASLVFVIGVATLLAFVPFNFFVMQSFKFLPLAFPDLEMPSLPHPYV